MAKRPTFDETTMSALTAACCLVGALEVVYGHLDLLESTDELVRGAGGLPLTTEAWKKIMASVQACRTALGQAD